MTQAQLMQSSIALNGLRSADAGGAPPLAGLQQTPQYRLELELDLYLPRATSARGLRSPALQPAGCAKHAEVAMVDEMDWNALEKRRQDTLAQESHPEVALP